MLGRGLKGTIGTACVVGIGMFAIVSDKIVSENGPEIISEPASAIFDKLKPLKDTIEIRLSRFVDTLDLHDANNGDVTSGGMDRQASSAESLAVGEVSDSAPQIAEGPEEDDRQVAEVAPLAAAKPLVTACAPDAANSDVAVLGDRLAVRFFEQSVLASAPANDRANPSQSIVFERLDLSGSYEVSSSGVISLPAIGHVDVIGRDLSCIETLVARAASERMRLQVSVNASFAARPPILVRGSVRAPGAHAYSPGLTVERVLAQAGAVDFVQPLTSLQLVSLKSREDELSAHSASLIIEKARIEAALEGNQDFANDPEAWAPIMRTLDPERVRTERTLLLSELDAQLAEDQQIAERIDDLVLAIEAAQTSLKAAEEQFSFLTERHGRLLGILERGITNESKVAEATIRQMDMRRVVLEKRDVLMRLEGDLRMARNDLKVRHAERRRQLAVVSRDITKERGAVHEQLRAVRAQLSVQERESDDVFTVTIERLDLDGKSRFMADPDTTVRPGDLVIVELPRSLDEPSEVPIAAFEPLNLDVLRPVNWR